MLTVLVVYRDKRTALLSKCCTVLTVFPLDYIDDNKAHRREGGAKEAPPPAAQLGQEPPEEPPEELGE